MGETKSKIADDAFRYDHLDDNAIRLIRILPESTPQPIHCALEHHRDYASRPEDDRLDYVALSYCWGDASITRPITINGQSFLVTENLSAALASILQYHNTATYYWIDAICLDQSNIEERNHQVHQMWRIYSQAWTVFAWIGPETRETEAAIVIIQQIRQTCRSANAASCPGWKKDHLSLSEEALRQTEDISRRSYFDRTWIIQEFTQVHHLILICGKYSLDQKTLFHLQRLWSGSSAAELIASRYQAAVSTVNTASPCVSIDTASSLAELVFTYHRSHCFDRRDRIFAMLGHPTMRRVDPSAKFRPDYAQDSCWLLISFTSYLDELMGGAGHQTTVLDIDSNANAMKMCRWLLKALDDQTRPGSLSNSLEGWARAKIFGPQGSVTTGDDQIGDTPSPLVEYVYRTDILPKERQHHTNLGPVLDPLRIHIEWSYSRPWSIPEQEHNRQGDTNTAWSSTHQSIDHEMRTRTLGPLKWRQRVYLWTGVTRREPFGPLKILATYDDYTYDVEPVERMVFDENTSRIHRRLLVPEQRIISQADGFGLARGIRPGGFGSRPNPEEDEEFSEYEGTCSSSDEEN